jgi:hypothetical protein
MVSKGGNKNMKNNAKKKGDQRAVQGFHGDL